MAQKGAAEFFFRGRREQKAVSRHAAWAFFYRAIILLLAPWAGLLKTFENARKTLKTVRFVLFEKTRGNGAKKRSATALAR